MKATVERPDGTTITIEGKPKDVGDVIRKLDEPSPVTIVPYPYGYPVPQPVSVPYWQPLEWTCGVGTIDFTASDLVTNGADLSPYTFTHVAEGTGEAS